MTTDMYKTHSFTFPVIDKNRWVNAMMIEERHMLEDDTNPLYNSIATFISLDW